jgi:membrane associated rhomboid family serine protease
MIPIGDVIPSRTAPVVTTALITVNALVFLYELALGPRVEGLVARWGLASGAASPLTILTSMVLHGSVLHFSTNILYLWIFGGSIEDRMGHGRFAAFYLLCGAAAALVHAPTTPAAASPAIGSSGALAGVIGAYFVMYPHSRVLTLLPLPFRVQVIEVPAAFFFGLWVVLQLISSIGSLTPALAQPAGGLAFWSHVAGLAVGAGSVALFRRPERMRVEWWSTLGQRSNVKGQRSGTRAGTRARY